MLTKEIHGPVNIKKRNIQMNRQNLSSYIYFNFNAATKTAATSLLYFKGTDGHVTIGIYYSK